MVEQHEVIGVTLEDLNFMPRIDNMACIADFKVLFLTRPVTLSSPLTYVNSTYFDQEYHH